MGFKAKHPHGTFGMLKHGFKEGLGLDVRKEVLKRVGFVESHQSGDDGEIKVAVGSKAKRGIDPLSERIKQADSRATIEHLSSGLLAQGEGEMARSKEPRDGA